MKALLGLDVSIHNCWVSNCASLWYCFCNRSVSRGGQVWAPEGSTAFKCLLSARFCAALLSNISDCDETFNYWEPVCTCIIRGPKSHSNLSTFLGFCNVCLYHSYLSKWCLFWQMHYLLYGTGMQTWEYSPLYAIRSYAYLWLHALPACLHAHVLQTNKVTVLTCFVFFVFLITKVYLLQNDYQLYVWLQQVLYVYVFFRFVIFWGDFRLLVITVLQVLVFYFVRCVLAFSCCVCELYFYKWVLNYMLWLTGLYPIMLMWN